jgi:hypothetical protein
MSDRSDARGLRVEAASSEPAQQEAVPTQVVPETEVSVMDPSQTGDGRGEEAELSFENLELLARFLMGSVILGGDELMERLRYYQQEIERDPRLTGRIVGSDQEATATLLRYLAIGLLARGQKRVSKGVRRGFKFTLGATGWALGGMNRLTDNRLFRPVRQSLRDRLKELGDQAAVVIDEGRREEQSARLLAGRTASEIIDEVLDYMSENPELAELVREQIGQQSVGLAGVVADNARSMTVLGDYVLEGALRRLLRRRSRRELPQSPLAGKAQTMYSFGEPEQVEEYYER